MPSATFWRNSRGASPAQSRCCFGDRKAEAFNSAARRREPATRFGPRSLEKSLPRFCLIVGLFIFLGHRRLRHYTPLLFPFLYAVMVYLEAPVSGTSTNPARSLGPSVISGVWSGWWIYFVGPLIGMLIGLGLHQFSRLKRFEVEIAKIYHFQQDRYGIFGTDRSRGGMKSKSTDVMTGH